MVHPLLEHFLRLLPFRHHHGRAGLAVCALSERLRPLAHHRLDNHRAGTHRLCAVSAHAAQIARRPDSGVRRRHGSLRLCGHRQRDGRAVVLQLWDFLADFQSVCGHAELAFRVGGLVHDDSLPPHEAHGHEGFGGGISCCRLVRYRRDRQSLLAGRSGRTGRTRHRLFRRR